MLNEQYAKEIVQALAMLPADKVIEARDFVFFLKDRYSQEQAEDQVIDDSDFWTEEDMREATTAILQRAAQTM